jgi:hypothetical protein
VIPRSAAGWVASPRAKFRCSSVWVGQFFPARAAHLIAFSLQVAFVRRDDQFHKAARLTACLNDSVDIRKQFSQVFRDETPAFGAMALSPARAFSGTKSPRAFAAVNLEQHMTPFALVLFGMRKSFLAAVAPLTPPYASEL